MAFRDEYLEIWDIFKDLKPLLPTEIIDNIFDYAGKWNCQFFKSRSLQRQNIFVTQVPDNTHGGYGDKVLISTPVLSRREISLLRKISFTFRSKDQGSTDRFCDHGSYRNSWTFFDAVLLPDRVLLGGDTYKALGDRWHQERAPRRYRLATNRHAGKTMEDHSIDLDVVNGHPIFDDLVEGDRVVLMASARFPGWVNIIEGASLGFFIAGFGKFSWQQKPSKTDASQIRTDRTTVTA